MILSSRILPIGLLLCLAISTFAASSDLWGANGEAWNPAGRLPDFSFAGYHNGEVPPPTFPSGTSVKEFGARGDGTNNDTQAFLAALKTVKAGAIEIPPGRYVITDILEIERSGIVLRGAGTDKTTLVFPKPLQEIRPWWSQTTTGQKTSEYSWAGGLIWFKGSFGRLVLADVTAEAKRGETSLELSTTKTLHVSQRVQIFQQDNPDNSLADELYSGDPGDTKNLKASTVARLVVHITKIQGNRISIDRPLRFAVKTQWHPQIRGFEPTVSECGVENLRLEFPNVPYPGHFKEAGYNAVAFSDVADCWARDLLITNCDSGIFPGGDFCTFDDIVFDCGRAPDATLHCTGHHGFDFTGDDNLLTGFDYREKFIHDLSVEHCAAGNVIASGRGIDLCLDHHVCAPYENLFTDIDAGAGTRLWYCGGGSSLGKHSGARETFWNIRTQLPQKYPPANFGPPSMNFVALKTDSASQKNPDGKWFENIPSAEIYPTDLHAAQLARRMGKKPDH